MRCGCAMTIARPTTARLRSLVRGLGTAAGVAALSYGGYAALAWLRYGRPRAAAADDTEPMLDRVMPQYDVVERHHIRVAAPAAITFATASEMVLMQSPAVRLIFRARERIMRAAAQRPVPLQPLLAYARSIGWGVLAETPGAQ